VPNNLGVIVSSARRALKFHVVKLGCFVEGIHHRSVPGIDERTDIFSTKDHGEMVGVGG